MCICLYVYALFGKRLFRLRRDRGTEWNVYVLICFRPCFLVCDVILESVVIM